jgi:hypothetical protein
MEKINEHDRMEKSESQFDWKDYENLIHKIYTELEPDLDVRKNDYIQGRESGKKRQIDISIRSRIAGHKILIIVQAKKLKRQAGIKEIGEFDAVIRDVQATRGIFICHSGFTKSVKEYAKNLKIDLCTAHDASKQDWQTKIEVPVIKKSIKITLNIQHSYIPMTDMTINGFHIPFPEDSFSAFIQAWERDDIPKSPGQHTFNFEPDGLDFNKDLITFKSKIEYTVEHRHHFKFFIPTDYRGLKDYVTNHFNPSYISFNEHIPYLNDGTWKYIKSPEEISINTRYLNIEIIDVSFLKKKMIRVIWEDLPEDDS